MCAIISHKMLFYWLSGKYFPKEIQLNDSTWEYSCYIFPREISHVVNPTIHQS